MADRPEDRSSKFYTDAALERSGYYTGVNTGANGHDTELQKQEEERYERYLQILGLENDFNDLADAFEERAAAEAKASRESVDQTHGLNTQIRDLKAQIPQVLTLRDLEGVDVAQLRKELGVHSSKVLFKDENGWYIRGENGEKQPLKNPEAIAAADKAAASGKLAGNNPAIAVKAIQLDDAYSTLHSRTQSAGKHASTSSTYQINANEARSLQNTLKNSGNLSKDQIQDFRDARDRLRGELKDTPENNKPEIFGGQGTRQKIDPPDTDNIPRVSNDATAMAATGVTFDGDEEFDPSKLTDSGVFAAAAALPAPSETPQNVLNNTLGTDNRFNTPRPV